MSQQPPYPPYPPYGYYIPVPAPQPPRRPSLLWLWITLSVVGGLLVVCCILPVTLGLLLTLSANSGAQGPLTPTQTTIQRPLSGLTGATLGGTLNGFEGAYGSPTRTSPADAEWDDATIAGQRVTLDITLATGLDGHLHVTSAYASPVGIGATWDSQTALKVMAALFPSDAQSATADTSDPHALIHVYTSATLGQTLFPGPSADGSATPTSAGEFTMTCPLANGGNGSVSYCFLVNGAP